MNLLNTHQKMIHLADKHASSEGAVIIAETALAVFHPNLPHPINPKPALKPSLS